MGIVDELRDARFLPPRLSRSARSPPTRSDQPVTGTRRGPRRWCTTTTSRRTTGCRNTRSRRCCGPRWRRCRASRCASAGPRPRSSRTRTASASPSPEDGAQRGAGGGLRRRLRRRRIPWCASRSAFRASGTDFDQLMVLIVFRSRELHEELKKRFPERSTYRVMHPDLQGLLEVLRPDRCRRGLLLSRAGAEGHRRATISISSGCCTRPRDSNSTPSSSTSASGICASRSRRSIRSAACSSPATPPTAIRPTAASV